VAIEKVGNLFLLFGSGSLFAGKPLNVFEEHTARGFSSKLSGRGAITGRAIYNSSIRDGIIERSTLILNLSFIHESMQLDVVSVNVDDSGISYSAIGSNSADVLTVIENHGIMVGSLIHDGKGINLNQLLMVAHSSLK